MNPLLECVGLSKHYPTRQRRRGPAEALMALTDVSLVLHRSEFLGLVGESGSGKSTLANIVVGLTKPDAGEVRFGGSPVDRRDRRHRRSFQRKVQIVLQDPYSSLDPRLTVRQILREPLRGLKIDGDHETICREVMVSVGMPIDALDRYPASFSGGQRQRIAIARALAPKPEVIVADEPVTALDVSVQAQVLNLLMDLRDTYGLAILLIAHDLAVVDRVTDRVAVMKDGTIVEQGVTETVLRSPQHPYTRSLLSAVLSPKGEFAFAHLAPGSMKS